MKDNDSTLTRAAATLRRHLESVTPGPWEAEGTHVYGNGKVADGRRFWVGDTVHDPSDDGTDGRDEAAYIVLMHPPVGLWLATLLERIAPLAPFWHEPYAAPWVPVIEAAKYLAEALLVERPAAPDPATGRVVTATFGITGVELR